MRLRTLRKQKHLKQKEIADFVGVERCTVSRWETGDTRPRIDDLPRLARILGCTVDELLGDDTAEEAATGTTERKEATNARKSDAKAPHDDNERAERP